MKTFYSEKELNDFVDEKEVENPLTIKLVLKEVFDDNDGLLEVLFKEGDEFKFETNLYAHTDKGERYYSWTDDFHSGSEWFKTVNKCLKDYLETEYRNPEEEVSCTSCGDGGCVHCSPGDFIEGYISVM